MNKFKEYPIYKKRDGGSFKQVSYVYADSFAEAKKQFAKQMTEDNHNQSNNIVWLEKEVDNVSETGWWNFNYEPAELFCSKNEIDKGFDNWSEGVYTWELRKK